MNKIAWAFLLSVGFSSQSGWAQAITKVTGSTFQVQIPATHSYSQGDEVGILNDELETMGRGRILKISQEKTFALVELSTGKAQVGWTIENTSSRPVPVGASSTQANPGPRGALSAEDRQILDRGEISTGVYVGGGIVGTYVGLGIGHAIQGLYSEKGWIFTVGELSSVAAIFVGLADCAWDDWDDKDEDCGSDGLISAGIIGFIGFRIWEIVDVWVGPLGHNRKYRAIKAQEGLTRSFEFKGIRAAPNKNGVVAAAVFEF